MLVSYLLSLAMVYVLALIVDALAPTFGGTKNQINALKVVAYGATAGFLGGIFSLMPSLSILGVLAALYSIYLIYTGLPVLMKSPPDKALAYTAVVIVCGIVAGILIGVLSALVTPSTMAGRRPRRGVDQDAARRGEDRHQQDGRDGQEDGGGRQADGGSAEVRRPRAAGQAAAAVLGCAHRRTATRGRAGGRPEGDAARIDRRPEARIVRGADRRRDGHHRLDRTRGVRARRAAHLASRSPTPAAWPG